MLARPVSDRAHGRSRFRELPGSQTSTARTDADTTTVLTRGEEAIRSPTRDASRLARRRCQQGRNAPRAGVLGPQHRRVAGPARMGRSAADRVARGGGRRPAHRKADVRTHRSWPSRRLRIEPSSPTAPEAGVAPLGALRPSTARHAIEGTEGERPTWTREFRRTSAPANARMSWRDSLLTSAAVAPHGQQRSRSRPPASR
jgi:hypothetical protein